MNLQIQCPKCGKRFMVHEDLSGKTVECGSCDHRFAVKSGSITVEKAKVYPGEHKGKGNDDFFNRLGRQPGAGPLHAKARAMPAVPSPKVDAIMPTSPARNIAAAAGFGLLIFYSLFFFLGTAPNGIFQDVEMTKRTILASFIGVVSLGLVIYGAKNWRFQATLLALVLVASLAALTGTRPVFFTPTVNEDAPVFSQDSEEPERPVVLSDMELKTKVGYDAVERRLRLLGERFGPAAQNHLVAIFVEDLKPGQYFKLEQYFMRAFSIPPEEGINRYERGLDKRDSLMVISGFPIDFDEAVRLCDPRLGRAVTHPELRLIELKLSALLDAGPDDDPVATGEKPGDRAFFSNNYRALSALSPDQVKTAVKNLAGVAAEVELEYQEQVVVEFMRLLGSETDEELRHDLAKGFRRWASGNQAALAVVADKVAAWIADKEKVPAEYLEYLIENKMPRALAFVDELWSAEPEFWSSQYALIGPVAEPRLIEHLDSSPMRLRKAAATLLGSVGSTLALPTLAKYQDATDEELRIIVARAITAIEAR